MINPRKTKYIIGFIGMLVICSSIILFTNKNTTPKYNQTSHADFQHYESLDEIVNNSEITILGKAISEENKILNLNIDDPNDPDGEYECSVYNVEIARVINGLYEKDTIEVKVIKEDEEHNKFINVGEEYIMFLDTFETIPASLLNLQQATIQIDGNKAMIDKNLLKNEISDKGNLSPKEKSSDSKIIIRKNDLVNQLEELNH